MNNYQFDVILDRLICHDTESIHSSDKFAIAGTIITDLETQSFIMPMMRINNGEIRRFPDDLKKVFSGLADSPTIGIVLQAWDIDENDSWLENREQIKEVATAISMAVKAVPKYGVVIGFVLDTLNEVIPEVINKFVSWDKNDQLLNYNEWINLSLPPFTQVNTPKSIAFSHSDGWGYSDWDYTLELLISGHYNPSIFGDGQTPSQPNAEPWQQSNPHSWQGVWAGDDITVVINQGKLGFFDISVVETINGQVIKTETKAATLARLMVEVAKAESVKKSALDNSAKPAAGSNEMIANLVQERISLAQHSSRELLSGTVRSENNFLHTQTDPFFIKQFAGDYIPLNNNASLEIYRLRQGQNVIGEALRYRRPSNLPVTAVSSLLNRPDIADVMLYRKNNLG